MVVELAGRIGDFACLSLQLESPLACCAPLQCQGQSAFPATIALVQRFWVDSGRSVLLTPDMQKFLDLPAFSEGTYMDFRGILLCARDPDYLLKMAKMAQGLPYEPSYRWLPDARTLAECPYCRLAISLDGKLIER